MDFAYSSIQIVIQSSKGYANILKNKPKYQIEQTVTGCDVAYFILIQTENTA